MILIVMPTPHLSGDWLVGGEQCMGISHCHRLIIGRDSVGIVLRVYRCKQMAGPVGQVKGLLDKSPTNELVVICHVLVNSQTVIF